MFKWALLLCVVCLAAFGAHELWHDHSVKAKVGKATDTAEQVGDIARDTTRKVISAGKKVGKAAEAAKKELTK